MREMNQTKDLLLDGHIVAQAAKLALEADAFGVVWRGQARVEGRAALGVGVVVVILTSVSMHMSDQT